MLKIAVIIPSFNRKDHLTEVLTDLRHQTGAGFELKTYAVVDGSTDGTFEEVDHHFPEVTIVPGPGDWYYTRCINEGVKATATWQPDLLLMLNDDISIEHNYMLYLLGGMLTQNTSCIMGSMSVTMDEEHRITFAGIKDIKWWRLKLINYISPMSQVDLGEMRGVHPSKVLPGRGMLVPYDMFLRLNMFDEKLPQYGSDDDFCLRAAQRGVPILVNHDAVVYSHHKLTGAGSRAHNNSPIDIIKAFGNKYSTLYLPKTALMIRRHGNALLMPFTISLVIVASLVSSLKPRT